MASEIVVNGRFLARRVTGVERYGHEILRHTKGAYRLEKCDRQGGRGHIWEQFLLPRQLGRQSVLWSPANTGPFFIRDQALTIHDLSPLEHPRWFHSAFAAWYRLLLPLLARRVRKVFTPSEHVRRKVIERFRIADVTVTANGIDRSTFHPGARQIRSDLPRSYLLFVGTLEPRKNLNLLLQAWQEIQAGFPEMWLIIVGTAGRVFEAVHLPRQTQRVCFLGYVDDETLAGLYTHATLFVLPSQDEGFGLPALEAMASGAPVLVSDGGALPELVGDAGKVFRLSEPSGLLHTLTECLGDASLRANLRQKGLDRAWKYSWEATAEQIWKALHEIGSADRIYR